MQLRLLEKDGVYHVCTKSIAGFTIFNNDREFLRMLETIQYYQVQDTPVCFSYCETHKKIKQNIETSNKEKIFEIVAYCLMPTHFHLIAQQVTEKWISRALSNILNSYTKYFNKKHNRKGPLWVGRFKSVTVNDDDQLLHLSRYLHLNPVTANLVKRPEDWQWSSYGEYLLADKETRKICKFKELIDIEPAAYKKFVDDRIDEQRKLAKIKSIILEDPY